MFYRLGFAAVWLILAGCSSPPREQDTPRQPTPEPIVEIEAPTSEQVQPPDRRISSDTLYDLLVAEVAGHRSNYELALENYVHQARETRDVQVTARATHLAQYLGATSEVAEMSQLWLELEPRNSEPHFIYALTLARQGHPAEGFRHMELSRDYGGQVAFSAIAAESLRHSGEQQQALLREIERALQAEPADAELLMSKSIVQQSTDQEAALLTARQARAAAPDQAPPIILEATLLQQMDHGDDAMEVLRLGLEQHPQNSRMRLLYARLLTRSDLPGAREQFEILSQQAPEDADLIFSLGLINREMENNDEAKKYFDQLLNMGARESEAHYYLGLLAVQAGDKTQGVTHFKMVRPGQDFMPAMNQLARILLVQGRDDELRQFFADQRRHYPQVAPQIFVLESEILVQMQQYQTADLLLSEALARYPEDTNLLYTRSLVAEKRQDLARAEADLRKILAIDPDNAGALNALGYILTNHSERYDEATELIEKALQLSPEDPTILDSMGWVKYRVGDYQQALDYLQKAYQGYADAEIAAHLGEVLWQLDRRDEALAVWREGLEKDADNQVLRHTIERFEVDKLLTSSH